MDQQPPPYQATNGGGAPPPQHVHITVQQQQPADAVLLTPTVVMVNRCPMCHQGVLVDQFTALGIVCAIVFFPVGILCCLMMTRKRCTNCGVCIH